MTEKVQLDELLKKKLAELEVSNPTLSEEETKKQKAEINEDLKPIKEVYNASDKPISEKIKLMLNFLADAVFIN